MDPSKENIKPVSHMRKFLLKRAEDESGISGTGYVAEGVEFTDGTAILRWLTHYTSTCVYENMKAVEAIHGHQGKTKIVWIE